MTAFLETFGTHPDLPLVRYTYAGWDRKDVDVDVDVEVEVEVEVPATHAVRRVMAVSVPGSFARLNCMTAQRHERAVV